MLTQHLRERLAFIWLFNSKKKKKKSNEKYGYGTSSLLKKPHFFHLSIIIPLSKSDPPKYPCILNWLVQALRKKFQIQLLFSLEDAGVWMNVWIVYFFSESNKYEPCEWTDSLKGIGLLNTAFEREKTELVIIVLAVSVCLCPLCSLHAK